MNHRKTQAICVGLSLGARANRGPAVAQVPSSASPRPGHVEFGVEPASNSFELLPLAIHVEPNKLVHREPRVQVGHPAFKRHRILSAARRLRFHIFRRLEKFPNTEGRRNP